MREEGSLIFLSFFLFWMLTFVYISGVCSLHSASGRIFTPPESGRARAAVLAPGQTVAETMVAARDKAAEGATGSGRGGEEEAGGAAAGVGGRVERRHRISTRLKIKSKPKNYGGVVKERTDSSRRCVCVKLRLNPIFTLCLSPCFAPSYLGVGCPRSCADKGLGYSVGAK